MSEKVDMEKHREEVETCFGASCGMCLRDCPIYRVKRRFTHTSKGKNRVILGVLEGEVELSEKLADLFYNCSLCGSCDARCALDDNKRFSDFRAKLVEEGFGKEEHKAAIEKIIETGDIYGRNIDLRSALGLEEEGDTPLYVGCQYRNNIPELKEVVEALGKLGKKVDVGDESCCGYLSYALGYRKEQEEIKKKFKEAWPHEEFLTICPTCTHFLKEEYELKATHPITMLPELLKDRELPKLDMVATYHDPCDLGRRLKIFEEPRDVIKMLGIELREMPNNREFSVCCGGGGGLLLSDSELADEIALNRVKEAIKTGADTLITACPTCEQKLLEASMMLEEEDGFIEVVGLWRLVNENL